MGDVKKKKKFRLRKKIFDIKVLFTNYIRKLLFPLYLFPIKLVTYSTYYLIRSLIKSIIALIKIIFEGIIFPFRSLKNLLKSIFIIGLVLYIFASLFVMTDYIKRQYGWYTKFFCSLGVKKELQRKVVRIVGGYSEGTGFFIASDQIITSFHVIADEPSPKVIFSDGEFITPTKIVGNQDVDLAVLYTEDTYPYQVIPIPEVVTIYEDEPLMSTGYPLGTTLTGKATVVKGNFIEVRTSTKSPVDFIQTNISLVQGMSGGPLTDQCGNVIGINTIGLAGLSLFISTDQVESMIADFTDQGITKIEVDPSVSPEEAVRAFYTYLKARLMEEGFALLSHEYLQKTDFAEWTSRFTDILDVQIFVSRLVEGNDDTVFVKFSTKNWDRYEVEYHYYEGAWQTVFEDGVYKMLRSNIKEVYDPDWSWFYDFEE